MKPATIVALYACFSLFVLSGVPVLAQTAEQMRIDELERRVRDLETRVRELLAATPRSPQVSDVSDVSDTMADMVSDTSDTFYSSVQQQPQVPSLGPPRAADEISAVSRTGPISGYMD